MLNNCDVNVLSKRWTLLFWHHLPLIIVGYNFVLCDQRGYLFKLCLITTCCHALRDCRYSYKDLKAKCFKVTNPNTFFCFKPISGEIGGAIIGGFPRDSICRTLAYQPHDPARQATLCCCPGSVFVPIWMFPL